MLKRFRLVDWVLAALIILILITFMSQRNLNDDNTVITGNIITTPVHPNDSLPYDLYKKISDSIEQLQSLQKAISNERGSGWSFLSLGYREINDNWIGA